MLSDQAALGSLCGQFGHSCGLPTEYIHERTHWSESRFSRRLTSESASYDMPLETVPSSVAFQPEAPAVGRIFPKDALVLTSYYGGGVHLLAKQVVLH